MNEYSQEITNSLEGLEIKVAYQEDTIDMLNQTVIKQQNQIDALQRTLDAVIDKLKSSQEPESQINDQIELPPHY
ncbi:MAG: SlyX family protein [Glaciecola sp.]